MDSQIVICQKENTEITPQCELCQKTEDSLYFYECVENSYRICRSCCHSLRLEERRWKGDFCIEVYNQKIGVKFSSNKQFYDLKFQCCPICFEQEVCCKICSNEHFFCFVCMYQFILTSIKKQKVCCPDQQCDLLIDEYLIARYLEYYEIRIFQEWNEISYNIFCPNKSCANVITFIPYQKFHTQILNIDTNRSQCTTCKTYICNKCQSIIKGRFEKHQKICNSEKLSNLKFKEYLAIKNVTKCPKCKYYSENDCVLRTQQFQLCQFCNTKICTFCNHEIELFQARHWWDYQYCFNCKQQNINKTRLIKMICHPQLYLFFLYFFVYAIVTIPCHILNDISKQIIGYAKYAISFVQMPNKNYYLVILWPITALVTAILIFVVFAILFGPFFIKRTYEFIKRGQFEMIERIYKYHSDD